MSLRELPRSTRKVFIELLKKDGPLRPIELRKNLNLGNRTLHQALRNLRKAGLVKRVPNLMDMRSPLYFISPQIRSRFKFLKS